LENESIYRVDAGGKSIRSYQKNRKGEGSRRPASDNNVKTSGWSALKGALSDPKGEALSRRNLARRKRDRG